MFPQFLFPGPHVPSALCPLSPRFLQPIFPGPNVPSALCSLQYVRFRPSLFSADSVCGHREVSCDCLKDNRVPVEIKVTWALTHTQTHNFLHVLAKRVSGFSSLRLFPVFSLGEMQHFVCWLQRPTSSATLTQVTEQKTNTTSFYNEICL